MTAIIGRLNEIATLDHIVSSRTSEFVAIYGRRRVGKTFLVRQYFKYQFDFELTGLANSTTRQQLLNFHVALMKQSSLSFDEVPKTWFFAFLNLAKHLETLTEKRKKIIFLDELPWLDTKRSDFLMGLEHFWNSWATNRREQDIILITCGSAASWMINRLLNNHGGLHNRVTHYMKLNPFNLQETEQLLKAKHGAFNRYQILQLYMVMGGIPYYLDKIRPDKSAAQNIENLCFREDAPLAIEFPSLFQSLFRNGEKYEAIIQALATKTKGLTRKELLQIMKVKTGGGISKKLKELEESGFVKRYTPFSRKKRGVLFRLADFYCAFYLKFLKNNLDYQEGVWANPIDSPVQRAWAGYAFEQVCLAHIPQIKKALGIDRIVCQAMSWQSSEAENGAQIDLLIDRRDQVINLCEVKFSIKPFAINKAYDAVLRHKIGTFQEETNTKKAIFLTMITTHGLVKNKYYHTAQNFITMDDLFTSM